MSTRYRDFTRNSVLSRITCVISWMRYLTHLCVKSRTIARLHTARENARTLPPGLGTVVTLLFGVEFAMAQTPNRMRGIMMGLVIIIITWSTLGSYLLTRTFHMLKVFIHSYMFYCYLALPPLAMLMLILFSIAAKRYKLRERGRGTSTYRP